MVEPVTDPDNKTPSSGDKKTDQKKSPWNYLIACPAVLISATVLSGSGIAYHNWYAAPESFSRMLVIIMCHVFCIRAAVWLLSFWRK